MRGDHVASLVKFHPVVSEVMDRSTDTRWTNRKIMLLSHTLIMKGSDVANFVEFRPVVEEEIAWRTDGRKTDPRKNNVVLIHPYHEGK